MMLVNITLRPYRARETAWNSLALFLSKASLILGFPHAARAGFDAQ